MTTKRDASDRLAADAVRRLDGEDRRYDPNTVYVGRPNPHATPISIDDPVVEIVRLRPDPKREADG